GDRARDAVSGETLALPEGAEEPMINNRLRGALQTALAGLDLLADDVATQRRAAATLQASAFDDPDPAQLPLIDGALAPGHADRLDARARESLLLAQAALQLGSDEVPVRQAAAQKLGDARQPIVRALLQQRLDVEEDAAVKASLNASLSAVDRSLATSA